MEWLHQVRTLKLHFSGLIGMLKAASLKYFKGIVFHQITEKLLLVHHNMLIHYNKLLQNYELQDIGNALVIWNDVRQVQFFQVKNGGEARIESFTFLYQFWWVKKVTFTTLQMVCQTSCKSWVTLKILCFLIHLSNKSKSVIILII